MDLKNAEMLLDHKNELNEQIEEFERATAAVVPNAEFRAGVSNRSKFDELGKWIFFIIGRWNLSFECRRQFEIGGLYLTLSAKSNPFHDDMGEEADPTMIEAIWGNSPDDVGIIEIIGTDEITDDDNVARTLGLIKDSVIVAGTCINDELEGRRLASHITMAIR